MTTSPTKRLFATGFLTLLLLCVVASLHLKAQTRGAFPAATFSSASQQNAQSQLQFEVASIHPHQSGGDDPSNRQMLPGGHFVATATTARTLIRIAFGTDDNRISGAPKWIDNETFDINAITEDHADVTSPREFQQLILSLLKDRFQLKFHQEQKEAPIYWLELVKPGKLWPSLNPATPNSQPNMSTNSNGSRTTMKVSKMSMTDIAAALRRQAGRPVEDHTGLEGDFDFQIEWAPEETPDSDDPSLFSVLKEELGLRLRPERGTTETVIIDQIAQPSAN